MIDVISKSMLQNFFALNAIVAFVCGVCLMYLAISRTIKKRQREDLENSGDS